jgi:hypothetical protein
MFIFSRYKGKSDGSYVAGKTAADSYAASNHAAGMVAGGSYVGDMYAIAVMPLWNRW